jgi:hypothetical protein
MNAKNAGLKLQVGIVPCRKTSPEDGVADFINNLGLNSTERVWIYPSNDI